MLDSTPTKRPIPFYGSYASFLRAMRELKENGIPHRVTTKALGPLLKDDTNRVVAGFAANGWIDANGVPSDDLQRLVASFGSDMWKAALYGIVPHTYAFISSDWADLTRATLRDAFVSHTGRDAEAIRSAETFFLCLATEAGFRFPDEFDRRVVRQIADARRSISSDRTSAPEKAVTPPVATGGSISAKSHELIDLIVKLSALLGEGNMTDLERKSVGVTISFLARQMNTA